MVDRDLGGVKGYGMSGKGSTEEPGISLESFPHKGEVWVDKCKSEGIQKTPRKSDEL
jgi:hypothetical protein